MIDDGIDLSLGDVVAVTLQQYMLPIGCSMVSFCRQHILLIRLSPSYGNRKSHTFC